MTYDWIHPMAQLALGLGLTAVALWAVFTAMKNLQRRRGVRTGLSIVGVIAVGTRERVVLLEAEGIRLLLGVTPSSITLLQRLPEPPTPFTEQLNAAIDERRTAPPSPSTSEGEGARR
ncbi:flagellar biosynthetic protein FliO [Tepidiphilus sp. J10]|uniref:FliO/MopB family protein n=1 Tax=Tepidiphilus sp. J10 TaxID=2502185 RepID=UPI00163DD292|nr:flagellar biosynthetic protein FliO [Tepidiphilus sp. J10]